jgi:hypothetical protein
MAAVSHTKLTATASRSRLTVRDRLINLMDAAFARCVVKLISSRALGALAITSLLTVACDGRSNGDLYLKRALDVIEENAVTSATVDWDTVRRDAVVQAGEAPTTSRAHAAIRYVLTELGRGYPHRDILTAYAERLLR